MSLCRSSIFTVRSIMCSGFTRQGGHKKRGGPTIGSALRRGLDCTVVLAVPSTDRERANVVQKSLSAPPCRRICFEPATEFRLGDSRRGLRESCYRQQGESRRIPVCAF